MTIFSSYIICHTPTMDAIFYLRRQFDSKLEDTSGTMFN